MMAATYSHPDYGWADQLPAWDTTEPTVSEPADKPEPREPIERPDWPISLREVIASQPPAKERPTQLEGTYG